MGKLTVKWERSIYDEAWHEFIRDLGAFLPIFLNEFECAAMLVMMVELGDDDWQSRQQFEQFCRNGAAREWLGQARREAADHALAKWEDGDFTKEASNNGQE